MRRQSQVGFTLIEMVIVLLLVGILSAYLLVRNGSSSSLTARSQADKMASDIRHMQSLAMTWGKTLVMTTTTSGYSVACASGAAVSPCNGTSAVTDPVTGQDLSVTLVNQVALGTGTTSLRMNSTGIPVDNTGAALATATTFQLSASGSGASFSVSVAPGTGSVSVNAP